MKQKPTDRALAQSAYRIRRYSVQMGEIQGQGYVGQALGYADVLAVAYCHAMNFKPEDPEWVQRDRFLLSHGHYAIAHYAALLEAGVIPKEEMETYGGDDSRLPMSGMASYTPGMEMSGGSLGQGLAIAVGVALGQRVEGDAALGIGCAGHARSLGSGAAHAPVLESLMSAFALACFVLVTSSTGPWPI